MLVRTSCTPAHDNDLRLGFLCQEQNSTLPSPSFPNKQNKMAAWNPFAIWLVVLGIVGFFLLVAVLIAQWKEKKKKKGKYYLFNS